VLTTDILFGMNVLSLVGFLVMGLSLTLHRAGNAGIPLSIGLMWCGDSTGIFWAVFGGFVKLAETDAPVLLQPECPLTISEEIMRSASDGRHRHLIMS
jgi:hypothetical protein